MAKAPPTAPAAPASQSDEKKPPKSPDMLVVRGPRNGRMRAGRMFGPEEIEIPVASLSPEQIAAIEGDPALSVRRVAA